MIEGGTDMEPGSNLPARRSLVERPQRLGFLPTLWFWNDAARQWLLMPIVIATAIPIVLLVQYLAVQSPALASSLFVVVVLYPFLLMGLVERHIRAQIRARPPEERLQAVERAPPERLGRAVPAAVGVFAAVLLALVTLENTALLVVVAVVGGFLAVALLPRTWRVLGRGAAEQEQRAGLPSAPREP